MAIYHFSAQVISRSSGRSVVAAAAYRAGERLVDERYGKTYDYTKKDVAERAIAAPDHAPSWVKNRELLWNAVEAAEKQKNAQLCREINIALPHELSAREQRELLSLYVSEQFVARGMIADVAIHRDNPENPHAHIMLTMRPLNPDGTWGAKSRKEYVLDENGEKIKLPSGQYKSYKVPTTDWDKVETLETWRAEWANYANRALERAGLAERIDHRSLEAQGSDRLPTVHEGVQVRQMERRGIQTDRGDLNRAVAEYNGLVVSLEAYRKEKDELVKEMAEKAPVEPVESREKQMSVLIAKAKEIKGKVEGIDTEIHGIKERLNYYAEQQQRISERTLLEKQLDELQQKGRSLFGLVNKNAKESAEIARKIERLGERIQEHRSFVPTDREAAELQAQQKQLEQTKKELSGQFYAVRNKVKQLEAEQEKSNDTARDGALTLRQALSQLKDKTKGVPLHYLDTDLDKPLEKARFSNRDGVEKLHYRLQDGTERSVLFENVYMSATQRNAVFDMIGAATNAISRELKRNDPAAQRQMKKKRRDMER